MSQRFVYQLFNKFADGLVNHSRQHGKKTWLAFLLVFSLILTLVLPLASLSETSVKFKDLQGIWAQNCIEYLAAKQIVRGYPNGAFKPNAAVSRGEFAVMLQKVFPDSIPMRTSVQFKDIPANYWGRNAIAHAYRTGFLSGYPDRTFHPNESISRVEALVSLTSGLKYRSDREAKDLSLAIKDSQDIPEYAEKAVSAAIEKQLVVNYPDVRQLNANQATTRAEAAAFLCQATENLDLIPFQYIAKFGGTKSLPKRDKPRDRRVTEIRGVWLTNIDSDVLYRRDRLQSAMKKLRELNFNTVYPTVWNCGYTLYPSEVAKKLVGRSLHPESGLKNRDLLKEVINQAHSQKMAAIPWFEFGFMGTADSGVPQCTPTSPLAKNNPDWLLKRSDGSIIWKEGPHDRVWFNPLHPEVKKWMTGLVTEIVSKYDVDGIQFDDHLGYPVDFGYDEFTVKLYQQEHQGKLPPTDAKDPEWIKWRADKITGVVKDLFKAVKAAKPKAIFSLSPNPWEFAYTSYLQDWKTWERQGLIEELVIQLYRNDINRLIAEMERPELQAARTHIPVGIGLLSGLKPRPIPMSQITQQVAAVRQRKFAGVSFFFYETLWNLAPEPVSKRQKALKKMFPQSVTRPNILQGWKPTI
ncbi:glycoside hydrolase family 10 protein [Merismopedia glauca]|uniref:SLH domain-containing protein n=1 Tax=Merismopedia glauca CCAP 1448/3 TaxID=1296344 RepID=A0A2T1BXA7_9CYAN|nr:family 10 glycosylhydrolase [Merismopedia glauca]PSB00588.1 hypothetical protein C7B64_22715 [Merismopedia glauca CCAP 1448/3]